MPYSLLEFTKQTRIILAMLYLLSWAAITNPVIAQPSPLLVPEFRISGAAEALERNIRQHVSLAGLTCESTNARINRRLPDIRNDLARAGRALGYYHLSAAFSIERQESCWSLQAGVEPGAPVTIDDINVTVASETREFRNLLDNLPVRSGDQLNHALYEEIKSRLSSLAIEQGFFAARFQSSQLRLDLESNSADIVIEFFPGDRFRIGTVDIAPLNALSTDFIQRFFEFDEEAYYSAGTLINLRNALNDSQYFSEVILTPELDQASDNRIPLRLNLQMRPRRVFSTGVGATTDIGPRLRFNYEDRYLNPRGHKFAINAAASPIQQNGDFSYTLPMQKPATESLQFSAGLLNENNDTYNNLTSKLSATYSIMNRSGWQQNIFLNYQHDEFEINDEREVADLLIPGVNLSRTRADDALYPSRGWHLFGQISGASDDLLSTESFLQLNLSGKWIESLGTGRFLFKFELGTTMTDAIEELPVSVQYFTGGDQSVRGYRYQSIGPLNELDEVTGGKHLLTSGIEYDFAVAEDWKLAVFADAGNAFNDWSDFGLKKSLGIGVRWLSPIGPIRVDLASPLDDDDSFRIHVTMGPDL